MELAVKRLIFFIGFCCLLSNVSAQEFFVMKIKSGDSQEYHANVEEKRISKNPEEFLFRYVIGSDSVKRLAGYEEQRARWMQSKKDELLSSVLDSLLSNEGVKDTDFLVYVFFNEDGSVFTVNFSIVERIYDRLPEECLKDMFNVLMREKLDVSEFWNFETKVKTSALGKKYFGFGVMKFSMLDLIRGIVTPQSAYDEKWKQSQQEEEPNNYELNNEFY